jgi:hypothetical protein
MDKNDPLAALISEDVKATDRKQLADLLKPLIQIDASTKEFSFLPAFSRLKSNDDKLEIILAAVKARSLVFDFADGLLPKEVIDFQVMPVGSTKSAIKRLYDSHRIKRDKDGKYSLPNHRVSEIADRLSNKQGKDS